MDLADRHDFVTFLPAFNEVQQVFGQLIRSVGFDGGYKTPSITKALIERKVSSLIPYARPKGAKKKKTKSDEVEFKLNFCYDPSADVEHCSYGRS